MAAISFAENALPLALLDLSVLIPGMVQVCRRRWGNAASTFVHRRVEYKRERLDRCRSTRDAVVEHIERYLRLHHDDLRQVPNFRLEVVYSGSYSNYVQARAGHFDFDILFIFAHHSQQLPNYRRDVALSWQLPQTVRQTTVYLNALYAAATSYRQQTVSVTSPSVTFTSNQVSFDLLPAIQYTTGGDGVYLIPYGGASDSIEWRLSFTKKQKDILRDDMEEHFPAIRDAIKVVKYWNQKWKWSVPSFAVVCTAYWMTESEDQLAQRVRQSWRETGSSNINWEKVLWVFICLYYLVARGFVPHMFSASPDANVLPIDTPSVNRIRNNLTTFALYLSREREDP